MSEKRRGSPAASDDAPLTFDEILEHELITVELRREAWRRAIQGDLRPPGDTTKLDILDPSARRLQRSEQSADFLLRRKAFDKGMFGLALSGGGIRSATFCLGVLQTLGGLKLLSRLDYLSTVSGGGYIGGWFSSLLHRGVESDREDIARMSAAARTLKPDDIEREVRSEARGIFRIEDELGGNRPAAGSKSADDPENENPSIGFLRRYSNYLTPRVGFLSVDTWTAVATYLRNLLLNFAILLAVTGVVLLAPRFVTAALIFSEHLGWLPLTIPALLLALLATSVVAAGLMDLQERDSKDGIGPVAVINWAVLPLILGAILLSVALASAEARELSLLRWCLNTAAASLVVYGLAGLFACGFGRRFRSGLWPRGWLQWVLSGVVISFTAAPVLWSLSHARAPGCLLADDWLAAAWSPPLLILWLVSFGAFQTGFAGTALHDSQREWLNRLGAWLLISAGAWNLSFLLILFGPPLLLAMGPILRTALLGGWIGTTLAGLFTARARSGQQSGLVGRAVLAVAPWVFVVGFIVSVALILDWGVDRVSRVLPSPEIPYSWSDWMGAVNEVTDDLEDWRFLHEHDPLSAAPGPPQVWKIAYVEHLKLLDATRLSLLEVGFLTVALLLVAFGLGWRIDINEFAMHGFYRNRLVRAFLGASRQGDRHQNPVTGFSRRDDLRLGELRPDDQDQYFLPRPPIHLVNTTVNMVSTQELAWQERKAASFVLSPYYCGFETQVGGSQGYRETRDGFGDSPAELTLGGAIATSGAAVSPNMGFRTSPALAALLTLFNVRLGRWIGNPGEKHWRLSGPRFSLWLLVQEILRGTNQRKKYLYLSDGGHFENLGIYELVRRRCRYVIAVDSGADPGMSFTDLGNAIRKCRIDLRVKIEVDLEPLKKTDGLSRWHCIVGKIQYPESPDCVGMLLYLKASLSGDEDADILEYRSVHADFPHQSTGDQFFDESQFESYRALGRHVAEDALDWAVRHAMVPVDPGGSRRREETEWPPHEVVDLESMRVNLEHRWRTPSRATEGAFTRHAAALDELYERARNSPDLRFLDPQIYPEWERLMDGAIRAEDETRGRAGQSALRLPSSERERRAGFYFCNSLIQLMENVYLDLQLSSEHAHPDNRGWMNLFHHWTWSPMFRVTWSICAATFGRRFQSFCEMQLGMTQGRIEALTLWKENEWRSARDLQARLDQERDDKDGPFLNFVESEQAVLFTDTLADADLVQVVAFRLEVDALDPNQDDDLLGFGVGYALIGCEKDSRNKSPQILLFRIQDHLRHLGLGRSALNAVLEETSVQLDPVVPYARRAFDQVVAALEQDAEQDTKAERFVGEFHGGFKRFSELVDSVLAERENRRRLRTY